MNKAFRRSLAPMLGLATLCAAFVLLINAAPSQVSADPATVGAADFPVRNDIDKHILLRLQEEKIQPSALCTDEEFLRRVYLDICGVVPSLAQAKAFLSDRSPGDKRGKLVDSLLKSERYADHWAVIWGDMLREHTNSKQQEGTERGSYREWLQESLASNMPYDKFARDLISATGLSEDNGAVNFYLRDENNRIETANTVSTVFMGSRMACAQCHDHPFDKWTQQDFHSLMAFFSRTSLAPDMTSTLLRMEKDKRIPADVRELLEPHFKDAHEADKKRDEASKLKGELAGANAGMGMGMGGMGEMGMMMGGMGKGRDIMKELDKDLPPEKAARMKQLIQNNIIKRVFDRPLGEYNMPTDGDGQNKKKNGKGEVVAPVFPWDPKKKAAPTDARRTALASFVTGSHQFSVVQVNRLWAQLMGRGLVDPTDDFREKNPPSHPEILEYLAAEFVKSKFDNQHVLRLILNSSTYQRSSMPNSSNRKDETLFSHMRLKKLTAEQVFDSILVATGRDKGLADVKGGNALALLERIKNRRNNNETKQEIQWAVDLPTPARTGTFMNTFNQSSREQINVVREDDGSISQALELLNGRALNDQVRASPLTKSLITAKKSAQEIATDLYLAVLSRPPTANELRFAVTAMKGAPTQDSVEDLHWALLNAREFVFNK